MYDLTSYQFKCNPHATYSVMRERDPVYPYMRPDGTRSYLILRYDDALAVLRDSLRFRKDRERIDSTHGTNRPGADVEVFSLLFRHMLFKDPPEHTKLRSLVSQAFTPKTVAALESRIHAIANSLLDEIAQNGSMDLIGSFAFPLPIIVICELLGIPDEDRAKFRIWSDATLRPNSPDFIDEKISLMEQLADYLRWIFEQRRRNPGADLVSRLIAAEHNGEGLSDSEMFSTVVLLLVAGHETTVGLIGNGMHSLLTHPSESELLKGNPNLIESAIEEMIRYDGPLERSLPYGTAEECVICDTVIPRGQMVEVVLASANRDPAVFASPDRFDITRKDNRHLGFGFGIHYCLGAPLARLEGRIAVSTLLRRFPSLRLCQEGKPVEWRQDSLFVRGVSELSVEWTLD